jgi:NADH:ubiquinone oxidoreductase subunit 5 (subunit L)/multisubunit Na+/H+ antiporter MnhA subunit
MLWALPLVPFAAALLVALLGGSRRTLGSASVGVVLFVLAAAGWLVASGAGPSELRWSPQLALTIDLQGFGRVMAILVPGVAAPIIAYAVATESDARGRLVGLMVAFVGAMELLVVAADFLTLLIAWELVGAFSWALIGHGWRDAANVKAAAHAFVTTRFGDLGIYIAAGVAFAATGSLSFSSLSGVDDGRRAVIAGALLIAAAAKSAQVPFSPWLFSAMAGPTPVSALLHSATMVAAGAYILVRLGPSFESVSWFGPAVVAVGVATAIAGGAVAATQSHIKRALAGSTSAQYGLMFVAVGAGSTAAAGAHLVTHAVFKSLLFLAAGVAIHASGSNELRDMRLGRRLGTPAGLVAVGALALAAVPPLGGAWTKEEIVAAAVHDSVWLGAAVFAAGWLSAVYAGRWYMLAYGPGDAAARLGYRPGGIEVLSLGLLAGASVVLGLLWLPGADGRVEDAVGGSLVQSPAWEFAAALLLVLFAAATVAALHRAERLLSLGLSKSLLTLAADWWGLPGAAKTLVVGPVLALSRVLARADDVVIDAGVRAAAGTAALLSRLLAWRGEITIDGLVRAVAASTLFAAHGSRSTDERGIDGAVEGVAGGIGVAGRRSRLLQTGLSHHYYVVVAAGLVILVGVLALVR